MIGMSAMASVLAARGAGSARRTRRPPRSSRRAQGDRRQEARRAEDLGVQASVQRNVGSMQMQTEVEIAARAARQVPAVRRLQRCDEHDDDAPASTATRRSCRRGHRAMPGGGDGDPDGRPGRRDRSARRREADARAARTDEQARWCATSRQDVSRLMLGWFATAHPVAQAQYTYAGEAESPDGKALRDRRQERRRLRGAPVHRPEQQPAADGHLQGTRSRG